MQQLKDGYRGLSVLLNVNSDLLLYVATLALAFVCAGFIGSL